MTDTAQAGASAPAPPAGILLGTFTPGTTEWDEARAGLCITATEIAAVIGLSPWQSRFSLWHKKAGLPSPPFEPNPAMEWGIRLEDAIASKYADEHPELTITTTGTWRHRDREWQRATPDRIADDRLLEVKTSPMGDGWDDGVPVYYQCQIQWQMDVLGYQRTDVAVLVSGHDYREYTVEYDPADAALMREHAADFLDSVHRGERPDIDGHSATYQAIRHLPEGLDDTDVEITTALRDRFHTAQDTYWAAEDELTTCKGLLLDAIGTGHRAVCERQRVATRTVRYGRTYQLLPARTRRNSS